MSALSPPKVDSFVPPPHQTNLLPSILAPNHASSCLISPWNFARKVNGLSPPKVDLFVPPLHQTNLFPSLLAPNHASSCLISPWNVYIDSFCRGILVKFYWGNVLKGQFHWKKEDINFHKRAVYGYCNGPNGQFAETGILTGNKSQYTITE